MPEYFAPDSPRAWKHSSKSFTNIQTPLSFTIVISLSRPVFPYFNFIYVVRVKESLLNEKQCKTFLIFDPFI